MSVFLKWLARLLAPHLFQFFYDDLRTHTWNDTITRDMVESLANDCGREISFDLQTGDVTIHPLQTS